MKGIDILAQLSAFNAGRDPERLAIKFSRMRANAFVFLRGSAHLFYAQVKREGVLKTAPLAWCCGDLHLENFGSYKGDNRLAYFDLNDFDEAALAPAAWEPLRLLTSLWLAADTLGCGPQRTAELARGLLDAYADALAGGKAYWQERQTASGAVQALLVQVSERKRAEFVAKRCTPAARGRRRLLTDGRHALAASAEQVQRVQGLMQGFAASQAEPRFFEVIDVARRIAGTGSLGLDRYVILVRGKGGPGGHYLLDFKRALPSNLAPAGRSPQPQWASEAARVVAVQRRMQAVSVALLHAVQFESQPFLLRELQPSEDRLDLQALAGQRDSLDAALRTMGRLMAWAQLRSSGRQGSASADELIDWGRRGAAPGKWRDRLIAQSEQAAHQVRLDWQVFCAACAAGSIDTEPPRG